MAGDTEVMALVADASRAELLRRGPGEASFGTVTSFVNPDAPPRGRGPDGQRCAVEPLQPGQDEAGRRPGLRTRALAAFAAALAAALEAVVARSPGTRLIIAAPPRLMRMIEARLGPEAGNAVVRTVPRSLVRLPRRVLEARLAEAASAFP